MTTLKNLAVAAASLVIFSSVTNAQTLASYNVKAEEPFKVKYLGEDGEYLVFQVSLDAAKSEHPLFAIADQAEGELYSATFGLKSAVKTIKIEKTDNNQVLDFKITLGKKVYSKSFSTNTSLVETVDVKENSITKL